MNVYLYKAGLYCEQCGKDIREFLDKDPTFASPPNPDDDHAYDSDNYPKGPLVDGGGLSDRPQLCASGHTCKVPFIVGLTGTAAGKFLQNPLTEEGYLRLRGQITNTPNPGPVLLLWKNHYGIARETPNQDRSYQ